MSQVSEQDARNLLMQHREYQARAEAIQQQRSMVQVSIEECVRALGTITELDSLEGEMETMLPIGSGSFLHAKLNKIDNVVVNIGAGISVEKSVEGAKETLNKRKGELEKVLEQMTQSLTQISQNMKAIEDTVSRASAPQ